MRLTDGEWVRERSWEKGPPKKCPNPSCRRRTGPASCRPGAGGGWWCVQAGLQGDAILLPTKDPELERRDRDPSVIEAQEAERVAREAFEAADERWADALRALLKVGVHDYAYRSTVMAADASGMREQQQPSSDRYAIDARTGEVFETGRAPSAKKVAGLKAREAETREAREAAANELRKSNAAVRAAYQDARASARG